jgi:hypothetical protein
VWNEFNGVDEMILEVEIERDMLLIRSGRDVADRVDSARWGANRLR